MNDSSANEGCMPSKDDLVDDRIYPKLTIRQLLATAGERLKLALAIDERTARLEARMLLSHLLQVDHAWIIAHANQALDDQTQANQTQVNQTSASTVSRQTHSGASPRLNPSRPGTEANIHAVFEALLKRRLEGEPMAYILEHREFYGMDLQVTPATLIPRADTETLVEAALEKVLQHAECRILDLGTGSGAIALAIAKNRPKSMVTAVDASPEALKIAQSNAHKLAIHNINFVLSDWFAGLAEIYTTRTHTTGTTTTEPNTMSRKFDIIVSNPPYIAASDHHLSSGDLRFEPLSALAAGIDGLDDIRKIVECAPRHLHAHGWLMLEHGYDQAAEVALLLEQAGFRQIQHRQDLAGIARVTAGCLD